ncbi:hypothetical protein RZS08_13015, partial [Arthrospira platensis SPKY1]|nr:hypothetical protein [Arthrospira platensis SPKY1]
MSGSRSEMDTQARSAWQWLRRIAGAAFALLLASALAFWLWASTPMALPQTLRWAQDWLTDSDTGLSPLSVEGARGSLTGGGVIEKLTWSDNGLTVEVHGLEMGWSPTMWIDLVRDRALT